MQVFLLSMNSIDASQVIMRCCRAWFAQVSLHRQKNGMGSKAHFIFLAEGMGFDQRLRHLTRLTTRRTGRCKVTDITKE